VSNLAIRPDTRTATNVGPASRTVTHSTDFRMPLGLASSEEVLFRPSYGRCHGADLRTPHTKPNFVTDRTTLSDASRGVERWGARGEVTRPPAVVAIELAAARLNYLPAPALLRQMQQPLRALVDGPQDRHPRHRTLRDTVGWSYCWRRITAGCSDNLPRLLEAGQWRQPKAFVPTLHKGPTCVGNFCKDWEC
jgi:hypothetical protein